MTSFAVQPLLRRVCVLALLVPVSCASGPLDAGLDVPPAEATPYENGSPVTLLLRSDGVGIGKSPYDLFIEGLGSNPVDGPGPDYIREVRSAPVGDVFEFWLPATGAVDPAFPDRQRNEIKVYNRSEDRLKAFQGQTMTYRWTFRVDPAMRISTRFCHLFQLKPVGGDETQPVLTFTVADNQFQIRHLSSSAASINYLRRLPYTSVRGVWLEATVTVKNSDDGALYIAVRKLDGTLVTSYSASRIDLWRGSDFNRPKWGIYRGLFDGMSEARVQFGSFQITKH